jgi:hypothetical protein
MVTPNAQCKGERAGALSSSGASTKSVQLGDDEYEDDVPTKGGQSSMNPQPKGNRDRDNLKRGQLAEEEEQMDTPQKMRRIRKDYRCIVLP